VNRSIATVLGFIVAPLAPVIVGATMTPPRGSQDFPLFLSMGFVVYLYSCFLAALFGVPTYLLFKRKRLVFWWSATLVGLLAGTLLAAVFRLPNHPQILDFTFMAPSGALGGIFFWLIWSRGNDSTERTVAR